MQMMIDVVAPEPVNSMSVARINDGSVSPPVTKSVVKFLPVTLEADLPAADRHQKIKIERANRREALKLARNHCLRSNALLKLIIENVLDWTRARRNVRESSINAFKVQSNPLSDFR
jgi:hypothetical protein